MIDIITAEEWGRQPPKHAYTKRINPPTEIVFHYNGPKIDQSRTPASVLWGIDSYHHSRRGMNGFAYNFAIYQGQLYEGRGWDFTNGAHDWDMPNANALAVIVCVGERNHFSQADKTAAENFIKEAVRRYKTFDSAHIKGHQEVNKGKTACPGKPIMAWVEQYRSPDPPPKPQKVKKPKPKPLPKPKKSKPKGIWAVLKRFLKLFK